MAYLSKCREHNAWPNFSLGNHDSPRGTTRFGPKIANDVMTTLVLLLPGTPITYYGEEIGMLDNKGDMAVMSDKREPCRSPMQWNQSKNAGAKIPLKRFKNENPTLADCFSNFASHYILTFDFSYLRKKVARVAHLYCIPIMRSIEVFKNSKMIVVC